MTIGQIIGIPDGTCFASTPCDMGNASWKFLNGTKYERYIVDVVLSRFVTIFTFFDRLALSVHCSTIQTKGASFYPDLDERLLLV